MTVANEAVVQQALDAFAAGDLQAGLKLFHPDIRMHEAESLPFGGTHEGLAALADMLATMGTTYDVAVKDHEFFTTHDEVVLRQGITFTSRETGRTASVAGVEIYRFKDGLISDVDAFYKDTKAMLDITRPAA